MYEQLANQLSRKNQITFTKVNVDQQQDIAKAYGVTACALSISLPLCDHNTADRFLFFFRMPTFIMFKRGRVVTTIRGADPNKLSEAIRKLATEATNMESSEASDAAAGSSGSWTGAALPRNYADVTDTVVIKDLDMANRDSEKGAAKAIFDKSKPSALDTDKGKAKEPDWVESDTDEQLMLYIPFNSTLKVHSLHITSLPPKESEDDDDDELPMRPKTIRLYTNRATILGFEEAEDIDPVQTVTIAPEDWDSKTGTAKVELRFVKFQKVNSMVVFFVDGDGDDEKIRIDRLRIVGEAGQAREMGKLEKIGDEAGE